MNIDSPLIDPLLTVSGSVVITGSVTTTGDILPAGPDQNLGSLEQPWEEIFVTTGSINFVGDGEIVKTLTADNLVTTETLAQTLPSGVVSSSAQVSYSGLSDIPAGIVSSSVQLTGSLDQRYVLSGSITQTTWDNIDSKPAGIVSGSSQLNNSTLTGMTVSGSFSGSFQGDGSQLTGVGAFPFTGSAGITGSLTVIGDLNISDSLSRMITAEVNGPVTDETILSITTGSFTAGVFEYTVASGSNARTGVLYTVWNQNSINTSELTTADLGDTSQVEFNPNTESSQIVLKVTADGGVWKIKTLVRLF
jgi:hypothetical protein